MVRVYGAAIRVFDTAVGKNVIPKICCRAGIATTTDRMRTVRNTQEEEENRIQSQSFRTKAGGWIRQQETTCCSSLEDEFRLKSFILHNPPGRRTLVLFAAMILLFGFVPVGPSLDRVSHDNTRRTLGWSDVLFERHSGLFDYS